MLAEGVEVLRAPERGERLDLAAVLELLAARGITRLMVEGGPTLAAALLAADLVDEAVLFHSPKIVGADGIEALDGLPLAALTRPAQQRDERAGRRRPAWTSRAKVEAVFTGIVSDLGEVLEVDEKAEGLRRLTIACSYDPDTIDIGASIACSGICLTVVERGPDGQSRPRLRSTPRRKPCADHRRHLAARHALNLERSLQLGDELGGHMVSGHVDGIAELIARDDLPDMARLSLRVPAELSRFIAPKGSVALDGVSLTVNEVEGDTFSVLIIPHTLQGYHVRRAAAPARGSISKSTRWRAMRRGFWRPRDRIEPRLFGSHALATTARHTRSRQWPGRGEASVTRATRKGARILIVEARYLRRHRRCAARRRDEGAGGGKAEVDRISVPGSLEIPSAIAIALDAAQRKRRPYDGAVALGCVIRGETIHFEIVSHQSARGLMELSVARGCRSATASSPSRTKLRRMARARVEEQDKGGDAARAALALVALKRQLGKR